MSVDGNISVELIRQSDKDLVLLIKGVPVYIINSIRRAAIADVPILAVDKVYIFENTSVMNDQLLAHRLGLIPLRTPLGKYKPRDECDCDGECPQCTVYLNLKAEAKDEEYVVKASDIVSNDPDVYPLYPDIEIVKLSKGQKIELTMVARMGRGRDHAKWSPVTVAVVRGEPVVQIDHEKCDLCGSCVNACPKGILKISNNKLEVVDKYLCTTCALCMDACEKDVIHIDINENNSILYIESVGQISSLDIVLCAIDELLKLLTDFTNSLEGLKNV